jgi:hypothetical protein
MWGQIIRTIPHFVREILYWNAVMAQTAFKITLRNFKRRKAYSLINLTGLTWDQPAAC